MKRLLAVLLAAITAAPALAQETVDLGTLRKDEVLVVQKILYPKEDRLEVGGALGVIVFDPYMVAPKIQFVAGKHLSEQLSVEGQIGAGYGLGTGVWRELGSPAYGVRPEVYRYLGSVTGGVTFSPIYAKMNFMGKQVIHHDVYIPVVAGVTAEQLAWGEKYLTVSPTLGIGVGVRVFQAGGGAVRIELRDDMLIQNRKQSGTTAFKQNVGLTIGYSALLEN
ncbi:hypothetical protein L6R49_15675 [Myxococcota bacterium]|nr:hypothetical protein [Myxococcota bacterium]